MRPLVVPLIDACSVTERDMEPVSSSADTLPAFALSGTTPAPAELGHAGTGTPAVRVYDEDFSEAPTLPGVQLRLSSV